ncbi:MAG: hypothetical protein KGI08_11060 [Thaumarchaeota archaeon]|nr:hypothetical protein [Nitrososphaerota archaeon]
MAIPRQNTTTDKYKFPLGSPVSNNAMKPPTQPAWQFGLKQKIQAHRIKATSVTLKDFVQLSNNSTASFSFSGTGQTVSFSTTLTPNPPIGTFSNFAVPYIAIYQGTTNDANFQIYPGIGGSLLSGNYHCYGGFDWHTYDGTISAYSVTVENVNVGTPTAKLFFVSQWKWLRYIPGTIS